VAGGAVHDALVGLAAAAHGTALATRDGRARATYEAVGVQVVIVV
jgi:predicted nucleic acid-binding protein